MLSMLDMDDTNAALTSTCPVFTNEATRSIPGVHKNDSYTANDLPPTYENAVKYVSPVLERLLYRNEQRIFLRKVLMVVGIQHAIILVLIHLTTYYAPNDSKEWAPNTVWVSLLLMFITSFVIICFSTPLLKKRPVNITMLTLLTLTIGFLFASLALATRSHMAHWTIATITITGMVLVIFTFQSKWDLTTWNAMCISLIVIQTIILISVCKSPEVLLTLCLSGAVIMLYFFTIIYDLRLMLEGKHEIDISLNDYSFVALNIHMDILIMYLLRRCSESLMGEKADLQTDRSTGPYQTLARPCCVVNLIKS